MEHESRNEFTVIWRIENFSSWCCYPYDKSICIPDCIAENLEKSIFYLSLERISEKPSNEEYLFCSLYSEDVPAGEKNIPIECTIEINDGGGETLQSKTFPKFTVSGFDTTEWKNIMKVDELLNKMKNWTEDTLTVRCHILGEVQTMQPAIECEITSKIGFDRCSFLWKVDMPDSSDWSERKHLSFSESNPIEITLSAPEDDVLINIQNNGTTPCFLTCRMSLFNDLGYELYSQSANYLFCNDIDKVWKFPTFFTKTILEDIKDTLFLFNHRLGLICNFAVPNLSPINEVRYRTLSQVNAPYTTDAVSSLQSDLRDMSTSKKHVDVKLRVDNEIFPAHKNLLTARSPVFSAMFDQDMLESRTGIVDIDDMDGKTMNSFLEFMYTGTVGDMDYENASKLLTAAEKYQVLSLKEKCTSFLTSILSEENVCEILTLADMVGHELLKASSLDYIKSHAGNILHSPQWLRWIRRCNDQLAGEIICMMSTEIASDK